jgi:NAD(P)-dependent dehydrogenase (short-subunit alcohol dehydrogenase family)
VCAIVGAGPGIGMAVARRFGRGGRLLALIGRDEGALQVRAGALQAEGHAAFAFPADAADPQALKAALSAAKLGLGPPDVLVYNAVSVTRAPPSDLAAEDLVADFRAGVAGALTATRLVLPGMRQAGRGTVLFTGGGFAFEPAPALASVGVAKAALRNLAFSLAAELGEAGIHVATVTICGMVQPGTAFDPERIAEAFWDLHAQPREAWERERLIR